MRLLRTALCAAALGLAVPAAAGAHAVLLRATPADGARIESSPRVIHLLFNENISRTFRSAQLVAADGRAVRGVRVHTVSGTELVLTVPHLIRGAYALVWHVVAEGDGHATSGTLAFGVGVPAPLGSTSSPTALPAPDVMIRWLAFTFTALLLGGLAFVALVLPAARPWLDPQLVGRAARRVLAVAIGGGAGALVVQAVKLVRQGDAVATAAGTSWTSAVHELALATRWGALWLAADAVLAGLLLLALRLRARAPAVTAPAAAVAALAASALAGVTALGSHAAALPHRHAAVIVDALHVLAASIWIGSLAALTITLLTAENIRPLATVVGRPFARLAGGSVVVLVLTGLYSAGVQVVSVDALLTTLYGQTLIAKSLLVVVCCILGAANFLGLRALNRRRLARATRVTLGVEAVAGAGVLLAAAVLTASAPARGPEFAAPRPVNAPTLAAGAADLVLSVTVSPNRPGTNVVSVVAASSRRPAPAPILGIHAGGWTLHGVGGNRWLGTVDLRAPGDTSLPIRIRRAGGEVSTRVGWRVEPVDRSLPVRYSSRRLSSLTDPALVALLAVLAALAAGVLLYRLPRLHLPREGHA
jgi:copper transport protein